MTFKRLKTLLYDLVYIFLVLSIVLVTIVLNGAFVANIANSLRMTGYLDPIFGIQVIIVTVSLVWIPIATLIRLNRDE
jgi:hypothetical protein